MLISLFEGYLGLKSLLDKLSATSEFGATEDNSIPIVKFIE